MDTTDEWICSRTGIRARRIAAPDVATSDLALAAARNALADAGLSPSDLDLIIVATGTPDYPGSFPSTAAVVQEALGGKAGRRVRPGRGLCRILVCAARRRANGPLRRVPKSVLVIGAETFSRILNWEDRSTAVLFGDGAGAAIVGPVSEGGYLGGILGADGSGGPLLNVAAGGSRRPLTPDCLASHANTVYQNGREVYKFAVKIMGEAAAQAVEVAGTADRRTWICSSRTRPTSASSRRPPSAWVCRWRKSSSTWTATATPQRRLHPAGAGRSRQGGPRATRRPGRPGRLRRGPDLGRERDPLEQVKSCPKSRICFRDRARSQSAWGADLCAHSNAARAVFDEADSTWAPS